MFNYNRDDCAVPGFAIRVESKSQITRIIIKIRMFDGEVLCYKIVVDC